jgi:hypothetical protein
MSQGFNDHFRVVAVADILWERISAAECVDDEGTVGDTFRGRQIDGGVQSLRRRKSICCHVYIFYFFTFLLFYL